MNGLPPIDQSLLPADVRSGSSDDRKKYATALGFERTLVNELTKVMADTAKPVEDGETKDAASSMYLEMLPDQLSDSIAQNGGLGLAPAGDNNYLPTAASGNVRPATGTLAQGVLEASNVDLADAMVDMMGAQRSYSMASKAIHMQDQMMEIANGLKS